MPRRHVSNIRSKSAFRRRPGQREPRSITLIVCEGETEQGYFEAARIRYLLTTAEVVVADDMKGPAPISVVQYTEERRRSRVATTRSSVCSIATAPRALIERARGSGAGRQMTASRNS